MEDKTPIALRPDEWDLIVLALQRIRKLTTNSATEYAVDTLGRIFLRRRIDEVIKTVQAVVPDAGENT